MLCPNCFADKGGQNCCGDCGFDETAQQRAGCLPYRTVLNNRYVIGRLLGNPGGFGVAYLAWNSILQFKVAIKEFFPRHMANRGHDLKTVNMYTGQSEDFEYGKEQFLKEARILAKFDHAHLVKVLDMFEENGTAYIVMEYYEGVNLEEYLRQMGGRLTPEMAISIMIPIMDGLREVHALNLIHRDIKPQNIYLSTKGRPILLDFGAARQAMQNQNQSNSVVLTEGFAPYEQYSRKGRQGPHTDVYGCAATLYYLITGVIPSGALDRLQQDDLETVSKLQAGIDARVNAAIMAGLAVLPDQRTPRIEIFQAELLAGITPAPAPQTIKETTIIRSYETKNPPAASERTVAVQQEQMTMRRVEELKTPNVDIAQDRKSFFLIIAFLILLILGGGYLVLREFGTNSGSVKNIDGTKTGSKLEGAKLENDDFGLYGIHLGDTVTTVVNKLGEPKSVKTNRREGTLYIYNKLEVIISPQSKVSNIVTESKDVTTRRKIHPGSTLAEVKRAYGHNSSKTSIRTADEEYDLYEYTYTAAGGGSYILRFAVNPGENTVKYIGCRVDKTSES